MRAAAIVVVIAAFAVAAVIAIGAWEEASNREGPGVSAEQAGTTARALIRALQADGVPVPCPGPGGREAWRYTASRVDLNGDGIPETLALVVLGSGPRGTAFVLEDRRQGLVPIASIGAASAPIFVSDVVTHGWRALIVSVAGAGAEGGTYLLRYDGNSYPGNASLAPPADAGALRRAGRPVLSESAALAENMQLLIPDGCAGPGAGAVRESLAGIRLGAGKSDVQGALGAPDLDHMGSVEQRDADRRYQLRWSYPDRGVVVQFTSKRRGPPWEVEQIIISGPAARGLRTSAGIGIGASRQQVEQAYRGAAIDIEKGMGGQPDRLIVQSGENYLELELNKNQAVERIYLGPPPE